MIEYPQPTKPRAFDVRSPMAGLHLEAWHRRPVCSFSCVDLPLNHGASASGREFNMLAKPLSALSLHRLKMSRGYPSQHLGIAGDVRWIYSVC